MKKLFGICLLTAILLIPAFLWGQEPTVIQERIELQSGDCAWQVTPDPATTIIAITGETIAFTAVVTCPEGKKRLVPVQWSGGGTTPTGSGGSFSTSYTTPGTKQVTAECGECGSRTWNITVIQVQIQAFNRVSPGKTKSVTVTTTPSPLPAGVTITLSCERTTGDEGSATVNPASITQTTTVTVTGGQQSWGSGGTAAPDNVSLKAKKGATVLATESFTVCAHPNNCTCTLNSTGLSYGLKVDVQWGSDSGNCDHLDKIEVTELITYSAIPNPPFCKADGTDLDESGQTYRIPSTPISGTAGDEGIVSDTHQHPASLISAPPTTGSYTVTQKYQYRCSRCNSGWVDMATYEIKYEIYDSDSGPGVDLKFKTTKTGPGGPFVSDEDIPGH